jgi:hypothetical protein
MNYRDDRTPVPGRKPARVIGEAATESVALRIPEAARLSGLSRSAIYREAGRGNIVLLKHGRTTLVYMASLRDFLAALPRAAVRTPHEAA